MDFYKQLYEFAKRLSAVAEIDHLPRLILEQLSQHTAAEKGLIVTRHGKDFHESYNIRFSKADLDEHHRRFSRSLVRECIRKAEPIYTVSIAQDERFNDYRSAIELGDVPILVTPLVHEGVVNGVIYLEKLPGFPSFDQNQRTFVTEMVDLAAVHLHHLLEREKLREFKADLERDLFANYNFGDLIGRHSSIIRLLDQVVRVSQSDATVLIHGETGTGKELIARALFLNSHRKHKPFVTLHCGALPESLFEAELFGHKRGAFTGAVRDRLGRIAQADGGTLFIDEVAEMPLSAQAKLLRFFQFGEYQRIGSDKVERVDIRILTATHRNLAEMVKQGTFREDLYYRLKVINLKLPPLRERRSDIPLLVTAFLKRHWQRDLEPKLSPRTHFILNKYAFPGNVRELNHMIERVCLLAPSQYITHDLLPEEVLTAMGEVENAHPAVSHMFESNALTNEDLKRARQQATEESVKLVEQAFLTSLMNHHQNSAPAAAQAAGLQVTYLYKLLRKHNMKYLTKVEKVN